MLDGIPTMRRSARIDGLGDVPVETTILSFRHVLERHDLACKLCSRVIDCLSRRGQSLRGGMIVDATINAAASSSTNQDGLRDPRMHQTGEGSRRYFEMKARNGMKDESAR